MRDFARSDDPAVQAQLDRLGALSVPDGRLGLETIRALLARLGELGPRLRSNLMARKALVEQLVETAGCEGALLLWVRCAAWRGGRRATTGGGGFVCLPLGCLALGFFLAILKRAQSPAVARR